MKLEQMMQKIKKYKRYKYWKRRKCVLLTNNSIVNTVPKESIGNLLEFKFIYNKFLRYQINFISVYKMQKINSQKASIYKR